MSLEELVLKHYNELNEIDLDILRYVMKYQKKVIKMSSVALAEQTMSSKSTITRVAQKLGFKGYSEFRFYLKEQETKQETMYGSVVEGLNQDILHTLDLQKNAKENRLADLVKELDKAEVIYCYATGNTQRKYAELFVQDMLSIGKKTILITEKNYLEAILSTVTERDMFIVFSLSGETKDFMTFILKIKTKGVFLVTITRSQPNFFAKYADLPLYYPSTEYAVVKGVQRQASSLIGLAILVEMIFRLYLEYSQEKE